MEENSRRQRRQDSQSRSHPPGIGAYHSRRLRTNKMRTTTRAAALASAVVFSIAIAACGKKNEGTVVDTTAAGMQTATVSVDTTPIRVSDIQVGKSIGSDMKVADQTTSFGVRDTMYVAVI